MRNLLYLLPILFVIASCSSSTTKNNEEKHSPKPKEQSLLTKQKTTFEPFAESIFTIQTFDGERILETGKCFVVGTDLVVAPFSIFREANRAILTPIHGGKQIEAKQYVAYDRISEMILLKIDNLNAKPLTLYSGKITNGIKTYQIGHKQGNTMQLLTGKFNSEQIHQGQKYFHISNVVDRKSVGIPVFVSTGAVLGMGISKEIMFERTYFAMPSIQIKNLIKKKGKAKPLSRLSNPDSERNSKVKSITLETDDGNIEIRLYNKTPIYRDNFIQLAEEGFYDSLLIHRVIRDFGIQMGAADTRHANVHDIVGWKGPGYTLPAHIVDGLYHKRGAIGCPRKPDTKNKKRRSDGSQFYIVTGRKYIEAELNDFEEDNGIKFTEEQREVYKTVGGSPHLDGTYTVFGEVISGLEIADRISLVATKTDYRPLRDIRLKKVSIHY